MKHEDLIALTANKTFDLAKDYIMEGLSVKLNSFENAIKGDLAINTEPRINYEPPVKKDAKGNIIPQSNAGTLKPGNFENYYERKLHEERQGHSEFEKKLLGDKVGGDIGHMMKDAMQNK
jgi:hypothetical protein